jgi:hypothetical protein
MRIKPDEAVAGFPAWEIWKFLRQSVDSLSAAHATKIFKIKKEQAIQLLDRLERDGFNDNGSFPTNEQGLAALMSNEKGGPYLVGELPNDPWGQPYHYRNPGVRNTDYCDLWSNGADSIEGTADDISN